ncbi:MAG: hypothetical protein IJF25_02300 [Oscillospiraceae bacterium]|nr:hypothetical protein [Oscillospiraceae bacterium]
MGFFGYLVAIGERTVFNNMAERELSFPVIIKRLWCEYFGNGIAIYNADGGYFVCWGAIFAKYC